MVTRVLGFIIVWQTITGTVWLGYKDIYLAGLKKGRAVLCVELVALFLLAGVGLLVFGCWLMFRGLL